MDDGEKHGEEDAAQDVTVDSPTALRPQAVAEHDEQLCGCRFFQTKRQICLKVENMRDS